METAGEGSRCNSVSGCLMGQFNLFNGNAPLHNNYPHSWNGAVVLLDCCSWTEISVFDTPSLEEKKQIPWVLLNNDQLVVNNEQDSPF